MIDHKKVSFRDLIELMAGEAPDKKVFYDGDIPYAWDEIDSCATKVAQDLLQSGIGKGSHAGLYGVNSADWIVTFFALQKLGAICILLNPNLRPMELAVHSDIADIEFLCFGGSKVIKDTDSFITEVKSAESCRIKKFIDIRGTAVKSAEGSDRELLYKTLPTRCEPDDPALMLFTSGSTGRPKCALLSAYNVLVAAGESRDSQRLNADDKTCLILPLFHIFGLVAGLFANILGGSLMYLPKDIHAATLIELIDREKCTVFHAVPTMMLMILKNKEFTSEKVSSVRCTILSGAAATPEQIEMFHKAMPNDNFLSAYGLSEAAPATTLPYGDTLENCIKTVGKPMDHIKLIVQDPDTGKECAPGQTGEILIRGENLMTGYYRVRIEDQSIDGEGWLHTGDLGYLRKDGYLCFSGRLKELIIRGGENIMPQDVADAVSLIPGVLDVRVVGVPSDFYGEEVCACIRMEEGASFDKEKAAEFLKERIAQFKIPSHYLFFKEFPVLATGKVDMVSLKKEAVMQCEGVKA